jgi:hypothetical protein
MNYFICIEHLIALGQGRVQNDNIIPNFQPEPDINPSIGFVMMVVTNMMMMMMIE